MDNNNSKKENRSMYLYTALIFVVALLLILVAFFSQTNISKLGKRADELVTPAPSATEAVNTAELAKIANMVPALEKENAELKEQVEVYYNLLAVNALVANENITEAEAVFTTTIDEATLSEEQRILYEEIKNKINERKEQ